MGTVFVPWSDSTNQSNLLYSNRCMRKSYSPHFFLLFLSLSLAFYAQAQTVTILDKDSKEAIEAASLMSESPKAMAVTNAEGQADISAFKGSENIMIHSLGYTKVVTSYAELKKMGHVVYMNSTNLNLGELVITATRWRQSSDKVSQKVHSIQAKEVQLISPQTAADLLDVSGKVFVQKSQQGGGSPMIRGFATNRLLYTVDGVRMNTAIFREGNIQNVINLDPFAIEHSEVVFGPGSVIYGSDAIGGVMGFTTLDPELSLDENPLIAGKAVVRYSSANQEKTGHFDVKVGWQKWALVTSFSSWDYDHLRQGSKGPSDYLKPHYVQRVDSTDQVVTQDDPLLQIPSGYSQINLMQKVRFKPSKSWDFEYGYHFSKTSPYGRYDRHNRMRNSLPRYGEWEYGPQTWSMHNLKVDHQANNGLYDGLTVRAAYQQFGESRNSRDLNADTREIREEAVDAYSLNVDLLKEKGRHTLYYGIEYVLDEVKSTGQDENLVTGLSTDGPSRYPNADWQTIGIYLSDDIQLSEKTDLQAGVRYTMYSIEAVFDTSFYPLPFQEASLDNEALTGSLGVVHRPNDNWVLRANAATAFRTPNVDDMGKVFDSEPGAVVVPNTGLEAEYAYSADIGLARVFKKKIKLDLSAYYTLLDQALVRRDFTLNGTDSIIYDGELSRVQAVQNAAQAEVYGLQIGLEVKLPRGFAFSSDLNYQQGEEEDDNGLVGPSRHAAPLFGTSRLTYSADGFTLQVYCQYQGEQSHEDMAISERGKDDIYALDDNGLTYAPSWYSLNLKTMYKLSDRFTVSTGLENITDQRYRPYSSGISAAGRNFTMALQAEF
jgi:hemoglobin/transferrin/lactoferrin receptor protein